MHYIGSYSCNLWLTRVSDELRQYAPRKKLTPSLNVWTYSLLSINGEVCVVIIHKTVLYGILLKAAMLNLRKASIVQSDHSKKSLLSMQSKLFFE